MADLPDGLRRGCRARFGVAIQSFVEVFGEAGTICWLGNAADVAMVNRNGVDWPSSRGREPNAWGVGRFVGGTARDRVLRAS